jgi:chromosome segregation ATPase
MSVKRSNRRTIGTSSDDDEYQPGPSAKRKKADKAPAPVQASKPKPKRRQNRKPRITKRENDLKAQLDEARDEHAGIAAQLRENNDQITSELEKMRVDYIKLEKDGKLGIEEMSARLVRKSAEMEIIQERYRVLEEQACAFKRDRTAQASLVPVSQKTEEEYLRDLQHLNQSIKDLAHRLSRGSKERRESLTFILIDQLWNKVFSVLVLGEDDTDDEVLKSFHRGLQGNGELAMDTIHLFCI